MAFAPSLDAAGRRWTGEGSNPRWSNADNWDPAGAPQNGEFLSFAKSGEFTSTEMENDLANLSISGMSFRGFSIFTTEWKLDGNPLTLTGGIDVLHDETQDISINCGITLGRRVTIRLGVDPSDEIMTIRLTGPLDLNGNGLEVLFRDSNSLFVTAAISGTGDIKVVNTDTTFTPTIIFAGPQPNTFAGSFTAVAEPGARPVRVQFNKPVGPTVNGPLIIGDACQVSLGEPNQIGDDAVVSVTGGGRLLLNGHSETLGSLLLTNVHADADSTLVDASDAILTLRGGITTSVFNEDGNIPTIKGTLALPTGSHVFNLNNQLPPALGLDLQGPIVGQGGFSKFGNATLVLAISNSFNGPVSVNDGILDIQNAGALGTTASGLAITDGSVILRNVLISGETLAVRGTKQVTANTAGSFLNSIGFSAWFGRIELDTNLVANSTGLFILGGPIVGPGGFEFLGSRHQIFGSGTSAEASDFSGLTRVLCDVLEVGRRPGFRGDVIVGGGFGARHELRWVGVGADSTAPGFPEFFVHTNGLVNLNGFDDFVFRLNLHGGRVTTGTGVLSVARVIVNPTNTTATIDGNLRFSAFPETTFEVADGPANPDLSVNAVISDGFGIGIRKTGEGEMLLSRANTYSGKTLVEGGTLGVLNDNALGAASEGTIVFSGATVVFGIQADTVLEPFSISGFGVGGTAGALRSVGDVWINTNIVLNFAAAIRAEGTNSRIQVNNLSGTGPLTKLGSGRLVLRGNGHNTYTGDTLVTEGVLDLAKPNNMASVPGHLVIGTTAAGTAVPSARVEHRAHFTIIGSVTVNGGGMWDLNGSSEGWSVLDLQGRPPLTLNDGGDVQTGAGIFVLPVGGGIVVNPGSQRFGGGSTISGRMSLDPGPHRISVAPGGSSVLSGPECNLTAAISETGAAADLEKDGGGALRLAGTNTYRGATRITGGTLQVDGVQPQSAARVLDGARLKGLGTVGLIEMLGATATVAPGVPATFLGSGSGILRCSNFNAGAVNDGVLFIELNGTTPGTGHDQINARGTVRLTGLTLQGSLGFASSLNQQFTIINNDGTDAVQGTFDGLPESASVYLGGERFTVSYTGGTGNDVVLTRQVTPQLTLTTLPATEIANFAVDFDGRFSRIHVGTNIFPALANNFTIELWANPTASRLATPEASTGISDITGQRHAVFPDQGDLGYGPGHAGAGLSIGTNGVSVFEHAGDYLPSLLVYSNAIPGWTHLALVYSNRQPRLYVNGALARVGLASAKTFVHPSANLGGSIQGLTYGNFQGQLDEVRIWTGARSQSQIQTNLNRSLAGNEIGLLLYYRCEETNGVSIADSAPAAPNLSGTLLNGVSSVLSGALPPDMLNGPTATLNGLASPGGLDASVWFEWGATTNYGNVTTMQSVSAVTRADGFSQTLAGLAAGEYQFRAVGSNGLHFSFGLNQTFTLLNGAPRLNIEKLAGGQVRLLWPTNPPGFTLQANPDLNTANWFAAGLPLSVAGTNNTALDAPTSAQRFYRLFHP